MNAVTEALRKCDNNVIKYYAILGMLKMGRLYLIDPESYDERKPLSKERMIEFIRELFPEPYPVECEQWYAAAVSQLENWINES